ncbi:DUF3618 domain-containing protein [Spirillospora albida]|uniref:DUF3618 domain-containing protein n=1 Tax=Spirillospora albida TaxID=58123 RepID=UPI00056C5C19|nr:DUF3618 domain-containing protein [Spirillospora albida]
MSRNGAEPQTDELRQEVDRVRHDLGETVEALAAKADVKGRAKEKASAAATRARERAVSAKDTASAMALNARDAAQSRASTEGARRGGAAAGAALGGAALLGVWLLKRRRDRRPGLRVTTSRTQRAPVRLRRRGRIA